MQTCREQQQQQRNGQMLLVKNSDEGSRDGPTKEGREEEEEMPRSALSIFRANEEEIQRKKLEVREKVFTLLGRAQQDAKRLTEIRQELEAMADPTRKDVAIVRRKIDAINRELKPLGQSCLKKEKEYKGALEAFNQKNKEKTQLVDRLVELIGDSERLRMKKLEELSEMTDTVRSADSFL